jgi:superfamily II DNA/RNA helicase
MFKENGKALLLTTDVFQMKFPDVDIIINYDSPIDATTLIKRV